MAAAFKMIVALHNPFQDHRHGRQHSFGILVYQKRGGEKEGSSSGRNSWQAAGPARSLDPDPCKGTSNIKFAFVIAVFSNIIFYLFTAAKIYSRHSDVIAGLPKPGLSKWYTWKDSKPAIQTYVPINDNDIMEPIPAGLLEELRERYQMAFPEGSRDFRSYKETCCTECGAFLNWFPILAGGTIAIIDFLSSPNVKEILKWKMKVEYFPDGGYKFFSNAFGEDAEKVKLLTDNMWLKNNQESAYLFFTLKLGAP